MKHTKRTKGICSKCRKPLEINRFRKQSYCNACHAQYMKEHRPKHSDLSDEQKLKANCRAYTHMYIKRGKLIKQPCEHCGALPVQAHHVDYSKPLIIKWLCKKCHELHHVMLNTRV